MHYFNKDFKFFFIELRANNNKEWFHSQKQRYEKNVKKPFEQFVNDLIKNIQQYDPALEIEAKECILRINRDIRFAKDKSPYNLYCTAFVSNGGRKDKSIPGLFLRFSPGMIGIMGGCHGPSKEQIARIRALISKDIKSFRETIETPLFKDTFGEIKGDSIKRVPPELKEAAAIEPLILNKQFYFSTERESELIISEKLMDECLFYWKAAKPVNDFLTEAIISGK
ncbi:MAG: DUF2461 domain-containing protein [SAR324 cluster bacterium]|nr:DUF2461 domain-containing protein [SAR324 cluster bacterium]